MIHRYLTDLPSVDVRLEDVIELDFGRPSVMQVSIHPDSIHHEIHRSTITTYRDPVDDIEDRLINVSINGPTMELGLREFVDSDCEVLYMESFEMLAFLPLEYLDLMRISFMMYDGIIKSILGTNYHHERSTKYVLSVQITVRSLVLYRDECVASCMIPATESSIRKLEMTIILGYGDNDEERDFSTCSICLEDIGQGNIMARMPCKHGFHNTCIHKWLTTSHYCPLCRFEMPAIC